MQFAISKNPSVDLTIKLRQTEGLLALELGNVGSVKVIFKDELWWNCHCKRTLLILSTVRQNIWFSAWESRFRSIYFQSDGIHVSQVFTHTWKSFVIFFGNFNFALQFSRSQLFRFNECNEQLSLNFSSEILKRHIWVDPSPVLWPIFQTDIRPFACLIFFLAKKSCSTSCCFFPLQVRSTCHNQYLN